MKKSIIANITSYIYQNNLYITQLITQKINYKH